MISKFTAQSKAQTRRTTLVFLSLSLFAFSGSSTEAQPSQTEGRVPTLGDVLDSNPQQQQANPYAQPGQGMPTQMEMRPPNLPPEQMQGMPPPSMQMMPPAFTPSMVDINSAVMGKLDIDLEDAQFNSADVGKLHLSALNLNMKEGGLKGLNIDVKGGRFQEMAFDQLSFASQGDMSFDRNLLLNDKVLQFKTPVDATVLAVVSQDSLNKFIAAPGTLEKLSSTASRKVGMLASMLGGNASSFGFTLSDASVLLGKSNRVVINMKANLGLGGMGVPLPLSLDTKLGLKDGWINLGDTHLNTNGTEISPLLSEMLVKKINGVTDWGLKSDDIHFVFTDLKVVPNKQFILKGTAQINRLRFGKEKAG